MDDLVDNDPALAADIAAVAAADAESAAEVASDAADDAATAAAQQTIDPAIVAAEVALATEDAITERAKIAARTEVKIAELNNEEPAWLTELMMCLTRCETMLQTLTAMQPSSIPPASTVIVETTPPIIEQQAEENADPTPASPEVVEPAEVEAAPVPVVRRKHRWT